MPPPSPINDIHLDESTHPIGNVQALEVAIRQEHSDDFRLPVLLRQYFNLMEAKVCDLSGEDFNQITEILMAADLSRLPKIVSASSSTSTTNPSTSSSAGTGAGINEATRLWLD